MNKLVKQRLFTYKWELIAILWLAFFFIQADRQIFNVVLPSIRSDLNLSDPDIGMVASILILTSGIWVPVAGDIGGHTNKRHVLMIMFTLITGAAAPYILGEIKPILGLPLGLTALSFVYIIASACIFVAVTFYQ